MILGGRALTNGIEIESDNYLVQARRENGKININIDELEDDDSIKSKIESLFENIPIIRGIVNYLFMNKFNVIFILLFIISDFGKSIKVNTSVSYIFLGFSSVILIILCSVLLYFIINQRSFLKYHGVEHKVINTYEGSKEINIQNVINASRVNYRCGTIYVIFLILSFTALSFFINYFSIKYLLIKYLLSIGVSYELFRSSKLEKGLFKYIYRLGGWFQKYLTTLEPNEEQLEVGIACLNKILELESC